MEANYIVILNFCTATVIKIRLSKQQIEESYKYEDFEEFLSTLENKYGFQVLLDDVRDTEREKLPLMIFTNRKSECCADNQSLSKMIV